MSRGNYEITAEWLAEVVRALPDTWRPLAQVHSHPGRWVEHSRYDDKMAMSRRALSLVIPFYGRYDAASCPAGVGVHECQDGYWHQLPLDLELKPISLRQISSALPANVQSVTHVSNTLSSTSTRCRITPRRA